MQDRLTGKQEAFCLNIVKGMSQYDSYLAAGYAGNDDRNVIDSNASQLADATKVIQRINELRALATDEGIAPVIERKRVLSEIVRARFGEYADEHGHIDIKDKTKLMSPAVQEVRTERTLAGIKSSLKLRDPVQAIDLLNKMDNLYVEKHAIISLTATPEQLLEANRRMEAIEVEELKLLTELPHETTSQS